MATPALVLIHGVAHAGDCWELTVNELRRIATDLTVLTPDLPGSRGRPGDLMTATIRQWVDSLVGDIDRSGVHDVVIVGHSAAGLTIPGVVSILGASRVREMVLAAACVPAEGKEKKLCRIQSRRYWPGMRSSTGLRTAGEYRGARRGVECDRDGHLPQPDDQRA